MFRLRISFGLAIPVLSVLAGPAPSPAADLHVPADYPTIMAAIQAAQPGDTILVANGVYSGSGNKWISFGLGMPLQLRSVGGPANCTIDCQNSGVAFFLVGYEPPELIIEGFTIINGSNGNGGAFFCHHGGRPTIRNCVIRQHQGAQGGAIYCENTTAPTFINCTISQNSATAGGGVFAVSGAAPDFINCSFLQNTATLDGGAVYASIGGSLNVSLINCLIAGNEAGGAGGGVLAAGGGTVSLINCTLANNEAVAQGGGLHARGPSSTTIVNTILWGNTAPAGAQIALETSGETTGSTVNIDYSLVQGGAAGVFIEAESTLNYGAVNLESNPNFANPAAQNYSLAYPSPAIDAGDAGALPADAFDLDSDGNLAEPVPLDRDGLPRVAGCDVDMGAFEFPSGAPGSGDFDGGGLSFADVPSFVQALLTPGANACIADVNGDGEIDGRDVPAFTTALLGP